MKRIFKSNEEYFKFINKYKDIEIIKFKINKKSIVIEYEKGLDK